MRARVEAKQAYLKTYNMAVQAENAAESQERKDRAARQKVFLSLSLSPLHTHAYTGRVCASLSLFLSLFTRAHKQGAGERRTF